MPPKKESEFTAIIRSLRQGGRESEVETRLIVPLIHHLGYTGENFKDKITLKGVGEADFICYVDQNPYLAIEAKSNTVNLSDPSAKSYLEAKFQLFTYMNSDSLSGVPYGLLINGKNAQVFQRKNKVIFPFTAILNLENDTDKTISLLKKILKKPSSYQNKKTPLIVSIYNNKGGVGKTVTTGNFDYILIDCPTNWSFFSKIGVSVSDAVLIPVNYQAAQAIHNAVQVIDKFIPEVWIERKGGGPEVLPILFNNAYTDPTSKKHFDNVRKDEIRKLTKDKWYSNLFEKAIEIRHHHEIATSLFLYMDQNGPSPYTLKNNQTKIFKEYEEILESIFGS
ncbi:type I restriction enzyme R protein N-terminal domain protein [Leptospira wolbachii serovar Codice str. CDC]|uniref:Type I restriction enzyme R protein N-terminal domain protein n=1 Tax=Leptospira wolbachii serovar Codice str. CDC TaxID=1218599 RepID=R9A7T4_9LEPT|nr:AAA family ATPase [Leptospira wolbachii]EOQ96295.1 type I restriction enzyme R protein N-terminal domain protein [Leptospira wolbachii serovar Codice str. CDC]